MSAVFCYQIVCIFQFFKRVSFAVFQATHDQHLLGFHMFGLELLLLSVVSVTSILFDSPEVSSFCRFVSIFGFLRCY